MGGDAKSGSDAMATMRDCGHDKVKLCGHETLAASHFLFTSGLVNAKKIKFPTLFGVLTTKREFQNHKIAF
ncbi:hypothetical protein LOK49_LG01G02973 [Camellia lanceoleosa]|uniref:Uncharacterized protein n=1 Tax=Camellia lanceoleosa TaxID=1840588 RepID=A0ACC0J4B9_9ERIC|nr:hypothetical protein LOK49_LG01G02973 [Camellia lanceoleosa]